MKARVHELARELGVTSRTILTELKAMGEFVKSASSTVEGSYRSQAWTAFVNTTPRDADDTTSRTTRAESAYARLRRGFTPRGSYASTGYSSAEGSSQEPS